MKLRPFSFFIIEYDGQVSQEGYRTFEEAEAHLKQQGYFHKELGWKYADDCNNIALIKEIQIRAVAEPGYKK